MDILGLDHPTRRALRRERVFRDRTSPFDVYDEQEIYARYRFTREGIHILVNELGDRLEPKTRRSHALSKELKVIIAFNETN